MSTNNCIGLKIKTSKNATKEKKHTKKDKTYRGYIFEMSRYSGQVYSRSNLLDRHTVPSGMVLEPWLHIIWILQTGETVYQGR